MARSRFDFSITRSFLGLTLPLALTSQVENLVGFAEILMVRSLGPEAISAVGVSRTIVFVLGITMVAVATGTMTMVAQAVGAGRLEEASRTAKQSITLVTCLSSAIGLFGILTTGAALDSLSVPEGVSVHGAPYLRIFFASLPLMALQRTLDTCLHAAGDTRTPFYISCIASVFQLAAAYAFIYGRWGLPEMGVAGAAVGGVVYGVVGNLLRFAVLLSGRFAFTLLPGTSYIPERDRARRILKIGIPSALQGLFRNGSNVVYVKLVAMTANPTVALAAYTIGSQIERTMRRTSLAFGTATTSVVGRGLGAGDPDLAESRGWTALVLSVGALVAMGGVIIFAAEAIVRLFTLEPEVVAVGIAFLYAIAASEPFQTLGITSQGSLRAAGDTISPLIYTIVAQWLIRLPCAYLLAFIFHWDIIGIWVALFVFSVLQGVLTARKFAQGKWKTRVI